MLAHGHATHAAPGWYPGVYVPNGHFSPHDVEPGIDWKYPYLQNRQNETSVHFASSPSMWQQTLMLTNEDDQGVSLNT